MYVELFVLLTDLHDFQVDRVSLFSCFDSIVRFTLTFKAIFHLFKPLDFFRPPTKLRAGNVFTGVCHLSRRRTLVPSPFLVPCPFQGWGTSGPMSLLGMGRVSGGGVSRGGVSYGGGCALPLSVLSGWVYPTPKKPQPPSHPETTSRCGSRERP